MTTAPMTDCLHNPCVYCGLKNAQPRPCKVRISLTDIEAEQRLRLYHYLAGRPAPKLDIDDYCIPMMDERP